MYEESRFTVYRFEKSGATLSSKSDIAVYEESRNTVLYMRRVGLR